MGRCRSGRFAGRGEGMTELLEAQAAPVHAPAVGTAQHAPGGLVGKVLRAVAELELDLGGRVVVTEAATGAYVVTPVLAALAGAEVHACARATRHGTVAEVVRQTHALLRALDLGR